MEYMVKSLQWERFAAFNSLYAKFKHWEDREADLTICSSGLLYHHYENMPIQIYWKFYNQKMKIFRQKFLIFFIKEVR